jgi:hypothetical protein
MVWKKPDSLIDNDLSGTTLAGAKNSDTGWSLATFRTGQGALGVLPTSQERLQTLGKQ